MLRKHYLHSWLNARSAPGLEWRRVGGYSDATVGLSPKESTVTAGESTNGNEHGVLEQ